MHADPRNSASPLLPCLTIHLGSTKTTTAEDGAHAVLIGRPVTALKQWLAEPGSPPDRSSASSTNGATSTGGR
ncbi:putative integrase-like protein [Rhizobium freirei PRF 81]|uniref:Putative integrase-like protein n=1 Tax=Rhizobium freirei PRF 81 TaxID=363754 RepID=N6U7F4_9HYPH|nr:putative integrase-like protein [Rhizobium freirei PRF 81]